MNAIHPSLWLESGISLAAGALLGWFYLRGLRSTVDRLPSSRRPGTLVLLSFTVRAAAALAVFVLIARLAQGHGLVAALLGFLAARIVMVRRARREAQTDQTLRRSR